MNVDERLSEMRKIARKLEHNSFLQLSQHDIHELGRDLAEHIRHVREAREAERRVLEEQELTPEIIQAVDDFIQRYGPALRRLADR